MIKTLKADYSAGWRSGMCATRNFRPLPDGLKRLATPEENCPIKRKHWLRRQVWLFGHWDGLRQCLAKKGY